MTPQHRLRPAGPDDREFLAALFAANRGAMFTPVGLPDDQVTALLAMQWRAQHLGHSASHPDANDFIIEMDGEPVGRILVATRQHTVHLVDVALLPRWTGRGIGSALVREVVADARQAGRTVVLRVARDNLGATALYRRLGFVEDVDASLDSTDTHLVMRHP